MRILPAILLSFVLGGCSGMDIFAPSSRAFSAPGPCGALARQRLEDARLAGLADGYEKAIFDHNYQACLKQEAAAR
ncbi:MAG TPA: hypothetical protein VJ798_00975 [Rhizomicrobium sp.]|nr:hypothetical protein [Rhizomicrobium sp.]